MTKHIILTFTFLFITLISFGQGNVNGRPYKKTNSSVKPNPTTTIDRDKPTELKAGNEQVENVSKVESASILDKIQFLENQITQNPNATETSKSDLVSLKKQYIADCEKRDVNSLNDEEVLLIAKFKKQVDPQGYKTSVVSTQSTSAPKAVVTQKTQRPLDPVAAYLIEKYGNVKAEHALINLQNYQEVNKVKVLMDNDFQERKRETEGLENEYRNATNTVEKDNILQRIEFNKRTYVSFEAENIEKQIIN